MTQVFLTTTIGYLMGTALSFLIQWLFPRITQMPVLITLNAVILGYLATLILAVLGSLISIRRVNKVDPAIVFRS